MKPQLRAVLPDLLADRECLDLREYDPTGEQQPLEPDLSWAVPGYAPDRETLGVVDGIMARHPFDTVVASSEWNVAFGAFLRSRYDLPGLTYDQALAGTNKWLMKRRLAHALPSARCWLSGTFVEGVDDRPAEVVVKPLSGASSKGVRRLPASRAVELLRGTTELLLVEEALTVEEELHCDGVVRGGEILDVVPSLYTAPVLDSVGSNLASVHLPTTDRRHDEAVTAARRLLGAIGVTDFVFHLELLRSRGRLLFGEIGLRPAGGGVAESLASWYGLTVWGEFVRLQLGRMPAARSGARGGHEDYRGVLGLAADPSGRRRMLDEDELRSVPGVVEVLPGVADAQRQAHAGSGSAFARLALFSVGSAEDAQALVAEVTRRAQPRSAVPVR
jgi:hypothetical protein